MITRRLLDGELEQVRNAGSHLFPPEFVRGKDFHRKLNIEMVKGAYKRRMKALPDQRPRRKEDIPDEVTMIRNSYELITSYLLKQVKSPIDKSVFEKKIIAVGGAKGGVGKSVFAANLAVFLSARGFRTVVVDLDLGGATVHLYLGKSFLLKHTINDFLGKRLNTLEEALVESDYGPFLIGGSNSEPGTANIEFMKKVRLIKAIGHIEADYIILDLGGDMSFNSLDFFLRADYGIVMTTPDAASYMSAYHFMRETIYRKLGRIFGPESRLRSERDGELERIIHDMTMSSDNPERNTIEDLMEKVRELKPQSLPLVAKALSGINPCFILNKVPRSMNVYHVPVAIQDVSRKWLSKEITYLGAISAQQEIEESVLDQVPVVARFPQGRLSAEIDNIVNNLLAT